MRKLLITAAALAIATPIFAAGEDIAVGTMLGKTEATVKVALTDLGYDVRKMDDEDGNIEAYVVKDKFKAEIYVDAATGLVAKVGGND